MRISDWSSDVCSSDLPFLESYRLASESKSAVLARIQWRLDPDTIGEYDACFLPLSDDGDVVDKVLCIECYDNAEREFTLAGPGRQPRQKRRSEEHTSELHSPMRISSDAFCLKKKKKTHKQYKYINNHKTE